MTAALTADFETEPYLHQLREFEASADTEAQGLLWQMRTGKTKVVIDTACHLFKEGMIDAVLVFAPNGVHDNWVRRELPKHHWTTVDRKTLVWRTDALSPKGVTRVSADERERWEADRAAWWDKLEEMKEYEGLAWFAFNSESMTRPDVRKIIKALLKKKRILGVFDESDDFRRPGSKRAKMARSLAKHCAYRRILTGTVVTNSPLHAFAQFELLQPRALGFRRFKDFKERYAEYEFKKNRQGQGYYVLKEYRHLDELRERMAPWSSVVLRNDCHDLPDVVPTIRRIKLTDEQLHLYRELHQRFTFDVGGRTVSVGENTSRITKLQQVVNGFLIDEYGDVHDVPGPNPRLEAVSDEVYLSPGKVLVWCQFHEDIDRVVRRLTADGHEVLQYHGRVSDGDKRRALDLFQDCDAAKVLVGQPQAGGRGLDLSAASEVLWYSHTFNAILRQQGSERATEIGGANVTLTDLIAPGVDEYILETTARNVSVADALAGSGMQEALRRMEL